MTELEKEIEQHLTKWFDGLGIETRQIKNSVRELAKISVAHTRQQVLEEAEWWEYNIIPAVRNKQVDRDVEKRLKSLMGGK